MSSTSSGGDGGDADADGPVELRGAQRRICDAYVEADAGLFVLNSSPGAGKTLTDTGVGARELINRWVEGDRTPEQHLYIVSFSRREATELVPAIIDRLRALVHHEMTPAAQELSQDDLEQLITRVRHSDSITTIDGLLRQLFSEIAGELGFAELPEVGNEVRLTQVRQECFDAVTSDPALASALDTLQGAYPAHEDSGGLADLLQQGHQYCRSHRTSVMECREELLETVSAVYDEGSTTSFEEIRAALARCVGEAEAERVATAMDPDAKSRLVEADQELHDAWHETIDAYCTLLDAYQAAYADRIREQEVISHTDCASLVAGFLAGDLAETETARAKRERVLERYHHRIESIIIDEAQDVSWIQHAALAPLITADCRVLASGDLRQSIYEWRDAYPSLFTRAIEDGAYLGIEWDTHVTETASTTYRCTPDIATAINALAEPALTDPTRGSSGPLDLNYAHLEAARAPTDDPSLHIAAIDRTVNPASRAYSVSETQPSEASVLANYVAAGLADGTLASTEADPSIGVLFRWSDHMPEYVEAFEANGLAVANASADLFSHPGVKVVLDVVKWLATPADPAPLGPHLEAIAADPDDLAASLEDPEWRLEDVPDALLPGADDRDGTILDALIDLREKLPTFRAQPASDTVATVIEILALRPDAYGLTDTTNHTQRVATLDKFVEQLQQWGGETGIELDALPDALAPFEDKPGTGPAQPITTTDHDVTFSTIHQAKGDEYDIVVLADLGWNLRKRGPTSQQFVTTESLLALAPPETPAASTIDAFSVWSRGLFDPSRDTRGDAPATPVDVGLRWATEHRAATALTDCTDPRLLGHEHLQAAVRTNRSEAWRLLYVALSRARDHLVLALPSEIREEQPTDRWVDMLRAHLQFDGAPAGDTYRLEPPNTDEAIPVGVNDVDLFAADSGSPATTPAQLVTTKQPSREALPAFVPRFLQPSTLYPLVTAFDEHTLAYLQNHALHTENAAEPDDRPLTLDAVDTETVGTFVHRVLTTAIEAGLPAAALRTPTDQRAAIIEGNIDRLDIDPGPEERAELTRYLTETIIPQFLDSTLWQDCRQASAVFVEKPFRTHLRIESTEFELTGDADVVIRNADGSWTITDIKTALTTPTDAVQRRYNLQVTAYAVLLAAETDADTLITRSIETFGESRSRVSTQVPRNTVEHQLETNLDIPRP